ncbi:yicC [Wigglesworthia glossinidia endosymbiont of Glossina brevipalpis]|uniref:YicC protein n=1 Tax=Wigglesworthia glossinidia brevipalpis TaxID=36870 RepID=Q8D1U9_WIGBR|nr:yicC [Wigglesworthia glossinidia endosymbiont of Glossina brevipalpis]
MIHSMTSFSRYELKKNYYNIIWELKSVNHKYLDININLPEEIKFIEETIYKRISKYISRGKIDCSAYIKSNKSKKINLLIDKKLILQILKIIIYINKEINFSTVNILDILKWPGVILKKKYLNKINNKVLISSFEYAFNNLLNYRLSEGREIKKIIKTKTEKINFNIEKMNYILPKFLEKQKIKLKNKILEINNNIEINKLEQDISFFIQKTDINEEIDRIKIHINSLTKTLNNRKPIGRKLDFILQEIIRESNTISSKSTAIEIIQLSIELKLLTDQIREQAKNIE